MKKKTEIKKKIVGGVKKAIRCKKNNLQSSVLSTLGEEMKLEITF